MIKLFVYGTLMRGETQEGLVAAFPARAATCRGTLYRSPKGYPVLVPSPDGRPIQGELLTLDDPAVLRVLDLYEGVPQGLYRRSVVEVEVDGRPTDAHAYVVSATQARVRRYQHLVTTDWRSVSGRGRR